MLPERLAAFFSASEFTWLDALDILIVAFIVNRLLRTFLPFVVFGIIVVFQSEIRKVLAHLGKTPFFGAFSGRRKEEVIDEVVLATTTLASSRTGAILVVEREMGLRSYIETGIA